MLFETGQIIFKNQRGKKIMYFKYHLIYRLIISHKDGRNIYPSFSGAWKIIHLHHSMKKLQTAKVDVNLSNKVIFDFKFRSYSCWLPILKLNLLSVDHNCWINLGPVGLKKSVFHFWLKELSLIKSYPLITIQFENPKVWKPTKLVQPASDPTWTHNPCLKSDIV